jgi:hypothetical protein
LENINENMEGNDYEDNRKPQIKGKISLLFLYYFVHQIFNKN